MIKEEKFLLFRVFAAVIVIFFINLGTFVYKYGLINRGITGNSIGSEIIGLYSTMPSTSKIFLSLQWGLLFVLLIYVALKDRGTAKRKKELSSIDFKQIKKNSKKESNTDLDTLYDILKEKKELNIITIQKIFGISEKLVLDWAKILESGDLAYLDYPRFRGVVLKLKLSKKELLEKKMKEEEIEKNKKLKKDKGNIKKPKLDRKTRREIKKFKRKTKKIEKRIKKEIKRSNSKK